MAPLILHNVPDEELYIGEDGVQRPYAMIYPHQDGNLGNARTRRAAPETGAFGKSTRRSRSKTATPARREDPTILSAGKLFTAYFDKEQKSFHADEAPDTAASQKQRRPSATGQSSNNLADDTSAAADANAAVRNIPDVPTEIILRGFKDIDQQYAAINRYEHIAGRICEDYPRDPPYEIRRYKSELRDPAFVRRRVLTPQERAKVNRTDSGQHWVKVTFESQQAADAALYSSPQAILGHLVYAEQYKGMAPVRDEAVLDSTSIAQGDEIPAGWRRSGFGGNKTAAELRQTFGERGLPQKVVADDAVIAELSPPHSHASSRTVESGTVASSTSTLIAAGAQHLLNSNGLAAASSSSAAAIAAGSAGAPTGHETFCRKLPTARKAVLLPAEQALLPQQSFSSRVLGQIPFLKWFSGSMIGSEVPRTAEGEFDWVTASLYWKLICWLDMYFRLFSGDICSADKDD
ncbi:hypothetical protein BD289DRAFT_487122 [Coniella lustricola]|uniref:Nucleoporin NUP53 n=1 Tax=Coniella lustricola TaxID=2025994 RepID=A0A2T2ZST4_9PEZI|nr:hypothetical protein BD289DRAFT_487122 [Coniella lustricola]